MRLRVAQHRPDLGSAVNALCRRYSSLRYAHGERPSASDRATFDAGSAGVPPAPCTLGREILAGLEEFDLRPALLGQPEVDASRREIHQLAGVIDGQIVIGFFPKFTRGASRRRDSPSAPSPR